MYEFEPLVDVKAAIQNVIWDIYVCIFSWRWDGYATEL